MRRLGSPHSNGTPKRGPECDITLAPSPDEPLIMGKQPCASAPAPPPPQPSPAPTPSLELLGGGGRCAADRAPWKAVYSDHAVVAALLGLKFLKTV